MSEDVSPGDGTSDEQRLEDNPGSDQPGGEPEESQLGSDPVELRLAAPPETGDPVVDEALSGLTRLQGGDLQEHLDTAETTHATLQQRLSKTGE